MDSVLKSLSHFGDLIRGHPPVLSPTLDDFELMQYMRQPLKPATDYFRILFNVAFFQPHEIEITVTSKALLEVHAAHGRRQNHEGVWMTRSSSYTYELPPGVGASDLNVEWSEDNYLVIQAATLSTPESGEDVYPARLVPKHVRRLLKPTVEMRFVRDTLEDIRDKSSYALRYIRFHTHDVPSAVGVAGERDECSESSGIDSSAGPSKEMAESSGTEQQQITEDKS